MFLTNFVCNSAENLVYYYPGVTLQSEGNAPRQTFRVDGQVQDKFNNRFEINEAFRGRNMKYG